MTEPLVSDAPARDMRIQVAAEDERQRLVRDVSRLIGEVIVNDEALRFRLAEALVKGLRDSGHRGEVYIPAGDEQRATRDAAIRAEFNGRNMKEVCRKFDVSRRTVYGAVGEWKAK